jgi:catechol 2,3-dioxygenase-like lactoylglutathione lyase family enzyme
MQTLAIHHVSVNVPDTQAALRFYVDVLGLTVRNDRPDFGVGGAWLDAGDTQVHLIEAETPPNMGQHFAVLVDDLDAVVAELRERGLDVTDPSPIGPGRQSFTTDPAGNMVELNQPDR